MARSATATRSATRLFLVYAAVSAVPVLLIGLVLAGSYRSEADRRGLEEGRAQAAVIASTAIEPLLTSADLRSGMPADVRTAIDNVADRAVDSGVVMRLRVRDLNGDVVYSQDGSGLEEAPEGDAVEAAEGHVHSEITRLNADSNDSGPLGPQVVEVYMPLSGGSAGTRVGVLEVYLPYDPIRTDIASGLQTLYRDLAVGLLVLYLVLAGIALVTTRRLQQQARRNAYLAEHDQLTGLPNRRRFLTAIADLTDAPADSRGAVAVLDMDRFKDVNDSLGHDNGDELLVRLGERLTAAVRPGDVVARLGGDEFGIVLARVTSENDALAALDRLRAAVGEPVQVGGLPLAPEVSIGFALLPDDGASPDVLLQRADIAMYVAKAGHAGVVRYDPAQDHYDAERLAVVGELRRALADGELVLHYQPKLRLSDGTVDAVEALVRWNHPRHGLLYPDSFLPLAEQTGLIDPLTDWVVAAALEQMRQWAGAAAGLTVAVNVSARNLSQQSFADRILGAVALSGLEPGRLVLEITETALFTDVERATASLHRLDGAGVPISLDDFGQGQTSLGYLSRLPLHELKVDKAFVTDLTRVETNAAIVRSLIELAHNLGFVVVAEGVEDARTLTALGDMGCDFAQGYLMARPMPAADVPGWMAGHRADVYSR
jgi:diguanylate cyclase